jgi:YHS domain-containing protein
MSALLYFAFWAGLFFLMMRFGCGAHVMGHGHGGHEGHSDSQEGQSGSARWNLSQTAIDPVCRMSVRTNGAKPSVYRGAVYYFCSAEHRDEFESNPERYVGQAGTAPAQMEHHHG